MRTYKLFDVPINDISDQELQDIFSLWIENGNHLIFTPNAEMLLFAKSHDWFLRLLTRGDLLLPDSVSLHYAISALSDDRLEYRHTGIDSLLRLAKLSQEKNKKMFLLGSSAVTLECVTVELKKMFPFLQLEVFNPGKVKLDIHGNIHISRFATEALTKFAPDVLAVALGHGKQEAFLLTYIRHMPFVKIAIGVGGALDMIAGIKPRAPKMMRLHGFEWLWRLLIEPTRIDRIIKATIIFPWVVFKQAYYQKCLNKAVKRVIVEVTRQVFSKNKYEKS